MILRQLYLWASLVAVVCAERRALQEIRYHFTPCSTVGPHGPSYDDCIQHYSSNNSRISNQNLLMSINTTLPAPVFRGAQIFRVPRFGLYNITVAGASGAEGICNTWHGRGLARTIQVELDTNLNLLLLVGQRGLSYCDAEPQSQVCSGEPINFNVSTCIKNWYSYLAATFPGQNASDYLGGGGGGGASMIRVYHNRLGLDPGPLVIGAGGGGGASIHNFSAVHLINSSLPPDAAYESFIDAKSNYNGRTGFDTRVTHSSEINSAGLGGAYYAMEDTNRSLVDGRYLGLPDNFAVGGIDCVSIDDSSNSHNSLDGSDGGFGGGGGACAGGGGGGGYIGGIVLGANQILPGGGGISFTANPFASTFKFINFLHDQFNEEQDGFINIVNADCECIFRCEVYEVEDEFECVCPGTSLLAPDASDCYIEVSEEVEAGPTSILPPDDNGVVFFYYQLKLKNRIFLYSINSTVTVDPLKEVDFSKPEVINERCILGFLGENGEVVAFTNVHRRSIPVLNTLAAETSDGNSEHVQFLEHPVVAFSILVVSAGNCTVDDMILHLNVSIRDRSVEDFSLEEDKGVASEAINELLFLTSSSLSVESSSATTTQMFSRTSNKVAIGVGVAVACLVSILFILGLTTIIIIKTRKKRCKPNLELQTSAALNLSSVKVKENSSSSLDQYHKIISPNNSHKPSIL